MPNTPPTAASAGSDLNGMAVYEACKTINSRLAKYKKSNPSGAWEDWVKAAFFDRVSLMRYTIRNCRYSITIMYQPPTKWNNTNVQCWFPCDS